MERWVVVESFFLLLRRVRVGVAFFFFPLCKGNVGKR